MNALEDKLRTAMRETGEEVAPHSVPPLRLRGTRHRSGMPRIAGRRWSVWLTPLAAAASVAAVVAASVTISATFHSRSHPRAPTSAAQEAALSRLPAYFVALTGGHPQAQNRAVVLATATGHALAAVTPPKPYNAFTWVSAAADDHTFVLAAERYWPIAPGNRGAAAERRDNTTAVKFFRLAFRPSSHTARLTALAVPGTVAATQLAGMTLSPDGTKLALDLRQSIEVVSLATGATRTWLWHGAGWIGNVKPTGLPMSWAADDRTLVFQAHAGANGNSIQVRLLDTATPGGNLAPASKVALNFPNGTVTGAASGNTVITPDGTKIVAATMTQHGAPAPRQSAAATRDTAQRHRLLHEVSRMQTKLAGDSHTGKKPSPALKQRLHKAIKQLSSLPLPGTTIGTGRITTALAITEFSVATGKPVRVLDRERSTGTPGWQDVLWTNTTGNELIVEGSHVTASSKGFGLAIGVQAGTTFVPAPQLAPFINDPSAW